MKRKCMICDDSGEKSIETKYDDFLKIGSSYVHTNCYLIKLTTRKKDRLCEKDALIEIQRIKSVMKSEVDLKRVKEDFFELIMNYYNVNIPKFFYIRIAEIANGTREGVKEPISYYELFEMYSNEKMMRKLDKIAHKKNMTDKSKRLFWDLSIIVNEYDNYKKAKINKLHDDENVKKVLEQAEKMRHVITKKETEGKEKDDVDIMDLIL